jgi:hypothetical protein
VGHFRKRRQKLKEMLVLEGGNDSPSNRIILQLASDCLRGSKLTKAFIFTEGDRLGHRSQRHDLDALSME